MADKIAVSKEIVLNMFKDMGKKKIDPIEAAHLIKQLRIASNMTQKMLAEEIGVPRNTLNNWESFTRITHEQNEQLEEMGYTKTQITNAVRNNKVDYLLNSIKPNEFNSVLRFIQEQLKPYESEKSINWNSESSLLIYKIKERLNKIESKFKN